MEPRARAVRESAIWYAEATLNSRRPAHKSVIKLIISGVVCHKADRDHQPEQREGKCQRGGSATCEDRTGGSRCDWQEGKQLEPDVSEHTEVARHFGILRKERITIAAGHNAHRPSAL